MLQNISVTQLIILLAIVLLVFGTKRLRNLGGDLGTAIRGFRKGLNEEDEENNSDPEQLSDSSNSDASTKNTSQSSKAEHSSNSG